jgi:hypothetical protein
VFGREKQPRGTHSRLQLVQQCLCLFQIERIERWYFRCPALGKVACSLQLSRRRLHHDAQGVVDSHGLLSISCRPVAISVVRASALLAQHTSRPLAIRAKGKALLLHALKEHAVRDLEVRSDMRHVAVIYGFKLLGIVHVAR